MKEFDKIKHFINRVGFGMSPEEYSKYQTLSLKEVVDAYFENSSETLKYPNDDESAVMQPNSKEDFVKTRQKNIKATGKVRSEWIHRMIRGSDPLDERMSLFWHGHFACRIIHPGLAIQYLNTLKQHGSGYFKNLVLSIAQTPAMIRYLNNQQNRKGKPNENFTRELMELFTLGRGNYSEQDVKEGARAFTGWSSNHKGEYIFRPFFHDSGKKSFLGKEGHFGGEDIIDIILSQKESAYFIAKSILKYFAGSEVSYNHIKEVADLLWSNQFHIGTTLRHIVLSDWFYDQRYIGNKIKSPVELIVGVCRQTGIPSINSLSLQYLLRALGQALFNPPNVAGWPGGKQWIDNATLTLRLNLPAMFFHEQVRKKLKLDVNPNLEDLDKYVHDDGLDSLESLGDYLLSSVDWKSNELLQRLLPQIAGSDLGLENMIIGLMSTPEYQMC